MAGTSIATVFIDIVPTVQGVQGNIGQAFAPAEREADAAGGRAGKKFAVVAAGAIAAGGAVVGVALKKLFDVGSVFDDVADTIRVGTGKTGVALEQLSDQAKTVATTIPTSFEAAGQTITTVTQRLGLTGDALSTVSSQFLEAGRILGQDVDIDSASKALTVFGIEGEAVSGQLDALFRASQSTGVGMNELSAAAAAQAPALQELGFNFEQTIGLIGSLDKAGLNSTAITASMGKGLVKLAKDGEEPQAAFQRITGELGQLVEQGDSAAAIDLASGIFGTKGATQMVSAIQSGTLNMETLGAVSAGTGDTILGVAAETNDAAESWQLFKNKALEALEPVGTAVFGLAGDGMKKLADSFDDVAAGAKILATGDFEGGFFGLSEDSPLVGALITIHEVVGEIVGIVGDQLKAVWDELAPVFAEVGKILGPAIVEVFETLKPAIKELLPVFTQLLPLFNPVSLIFKALLPVLPQIADMIGQLANVLAEFVAGALKSLAPLFEKVVEVINKLLPMITDLVMSLLPPLMGLFEKLAPLLDAILASLLPVVDELVNGLMWAIDALMPVVERVFGFIGETIENIMTVLGGLIDFVTGVFSGDWGLAWDGIKTVFLGVWEQMKASFQLIWDYIQALLGAGWNWIRDNVLTPLGAGIENLEEFFTGLWTTVSDVWTWIQDKISTAWTWINQNVFAPMNLAINTIGTFFSGLWTTVESVWSKISNFFVNVAEGIADAVETVETAIKDITNAILAFLGLDFNSVTVNPDGSATVKGPNVAALPFTFGRARGGIIPGSDPGRRDNMLGRLPSGQGIGLRSEEAIMVPEFTHSVGGAAGVYALNRAAESGRLGDMLGGGFARGGVIGQAFHDLISNAASRVLKGREEQVKSSASRVGDYGPENPSGLASNTAAAKAFITQMWGITNIGGWRASGSVAGSDHPKGKALDVMIANYMSQQGIAQGNSIADWFIKNPGNFGTKYVIWRDRINQNGSWSQYSHPGGNNDTLAHRDHVHLSFLTGAAEAAGRAVGDSVAGSGVERWRSLALQALAATGQPASNVDRMLNQIRTESSGDPNAQNNTDINAQRGYPSQGLLQVIRPTFEAALRGTKFANLIPLGPKDPWANMISSILYGVNRYGSLAGAYRGVAYDQGGMLAPNGIGVNLLNKPEAVLTPPQTAAYQAHARALEDGFAGGIGSIQVYLGGKEIKDEMRVVVDGVLVEAGREVERVRGRS